MDESNVVDLLPLIAECVLRRALKMRRLVRRRLEDNGYTAVANPNARTSDGMWFIDGKRQGIYVRATLDQAQRLTVAQELHAALSAKK